MMFNSSDSWVSISVGFVQSTACREDQLREDCKAAFVCGYGQWLTDEQKIEVPKRSVIGTNGNI